MKLLIFSDISRLSEKTIEAISKCEYDLCVTLGDIPTSTLHLVKEIVKSPIYGLNGEKDNQSVENAQIHNLHLNRIKIDGFSIGGFQYDDECKCWKDEYESRFKDKLEKVDIMLTHHSHSQKINALGQFDTVNYIERLVRILQPNINIYGHEKTNVIGTIKEYKCKDIRTIGICGVVFIEIDKSYMKRFIVMQDGN